MKRIFALLVCVSLLIAACGSQSREAQPLSPPIVDNVAMMIATPASPLDANRNEVLREDNAPTNTVDGRIVLKDAQLSLTVEDAAATIARISQVADSLGGWVVNANQSNTTRSDGSLVTQGTISIRVPAARFNDVLSQIKTDAVSVDSETVNGQDVTQDYVDTASQITNLQAAETQLQAIMERARTTTDVLSIHEELVRVRGEIEVLQGRIRYYDEAAAYSSIVTSLRTVTAPVPVEVANTSFDPGRTVSTALAALVDVLQAGAEVLIYALVFVVPLLLIVGLPLWLLYRVVRRRMPVRPSAS